MLSKHQQTFVNNNKTATSVKFHSRSLNSFLFDRKTIWCFKNNYFVVILFCCFVTQNQTNKNFSPNSPPSPFRTRNFRDSSVTINVVKSLPNNPSFATRRTDQVWAQRKHSRANFWTNLRTRCCKRSLVLSAPIRVIKAPRVSCARKPKTVTLIPPILSLNELYVCMDPVIAYRSVW